MSDDDHRAWLDLVTPNTGDVEFPRPPACGMPSPTNAMLCDLPTTYGNRHEFAQHLGTDRRGNLRGWPDKR